jgi:hypothetical protein
MDGAILFIGEPQWYSAEYFPHSRIHDRCELHYIVEQLVSVVGFLLLVLMLVLLRRRERRQEEEIIAESTTKA